MLALHLLQASLVLLNTLLVEAMLADPAFRERIGPAERRGLSALFWTHLNPCGRLVLDMDARSDLTRNNAPT